MDIQIDGHVTERKYWFALSTALYYGGRISCLSILHDTNLPNGLPFDPYRLYHALLQRRDVLEKLYHRGALSYDEWRLLFPAHHQTYSKSFELGMLIALLHHLTLPPPVQGWANAPRPHETALSFSLLKLREYKDKLSKWEDTQDMTYEEFLLEWNALCEILFGLGFNVSHLHPIFEAVQTENFQFRREFKKEFHKALKEAKILYFRKTLHELRTFYTRHLDNVVTIMSVVGFDRMEYLQNHALDLKDPLKELEEEFDRLVKKRYKTPLKYLYDAEYLSNEVSKNDTALDKEIEKHNRRVEREDMKVKKKTEVDENTDAKHPLKTTLSMRRASIVGWLRRNTLRSVSRSPRPTVLPSENGDEVFTNGIEVGEY